MSGVLRIDGDFLEVPAAAPERLIGRHLRPRRAGIVGSKETAELFRRRRARRGHRLHRRRHPASAAARFGAPAAGRRRIGKQIIDHRIDALRIARRHRDARAADAFLRQAVRQLLPRGAAVGRLEDAAARPVRRLIRVPGRPPRIPQAGVDDVGVRRIDHDVHRAEIVVLEQHLLPRLAAVARPEDAAIRIRRVQVADRRDEDDVRILRIDRRCWPMCCVSSSPRCVHVLPASVDL